MAIIIYPEGDKRFSVNNIQYLKNYSTTVKGSKVEIFNCYERSDVLVPLTHYSQFMVEGVTFPNATALQEALLPVLYSRSSLGGDGPETDQNNLDVVRYVRSAAAGAEAILSAINTLEMYRLDDKQSLWFVVTVPGTAGINGRISSPFIYKYKMTNYGKGSYGDGAFQLGHNDIELVYATTACAGDIASQPGTQVIEFGALTNITVREWFVNNYQISTIQPHSEGYTLFKGTINGVYNTYLWLGTDGPHNTAATMPLQSDFLPLHDVIPVTDQDNIDIKKTFTLTSRDYDKNTVLATVNNLPPYRVNENQSVWYVGSQPLRGLNTNTSIRDPAPVNPLIVKYRLLNNGKGIYGAGYTQLLPADIELMYSNEATLNDLEAVTSTRIVHFTHTAGQSVSQWLNARATAIVIQPQGDGYTIFKSTVAGDGLAYLWIGDDGAYGNGRLQSVPADFQLLNETIPPVNQDNIEIKKFFYLPADYTQATILQRINSISIYEVTDTQSVWFIGSQQTRFTPGELVTTNPLLLKYKMFNKGKGLYGEGGIQLTRNDIELVYSNEASLQDMESAVETQIIYTAAIEDLDITSWLNSQSAAINIRTQEEGYTIFKDITGEEEESWLWIGPEGLYGNAHLQSAATNFQLLNKAVLPQDQDNIDIKKTFNLLENVSIENVLTRINGLPRYTVSEKQSVWFVGQGTFRSGASANYRTLTYKYKMLNRGKGTYGRRGTQLTANDIELVYANEATLQEIESSVQTELITVSLSQDETVSEWLNNSTPFIAIQPQENGYTILKEIREDGELSWLWLGIEGNYGVGQLQSTDADFQLLNDIAPAPFVPTLNQVMEAGNSSGIPLVVETISSETIGGNYKITYSSTDIAYQKDATGGSTIGFEDPISENFIEYRVPAKYTNDVFAMRSDLHKPVKIITNATTGFENGTYTLQPGDQELWLLFKVPADFIIKIPLGSFEPYVLFEGENADIGQATFVAEGNIILHHGASELPKTAEINSVFGLKFRSATDVSLFGKLELL